LPSRRCTVFLLPQFSLLFLSLPEGVGKVTPPQRSPFIRFFLLSSLTVSCPPHSSPQTFLVRPPKGIVRLPLLTALPANRLLVKPNKIRHLPLRSTSGGPVFESVPLVLLYFLAAQRKPLVWLPPPPKPPILFSVS